MVDLSTLDQLVALSRALGLPERALVIFGEGNTSARASDEGFWVKASGTRLHGINPESFVLLDRKRTVALLEEDLPDDAAVSQALRGVTVTARGVLTPSIEAIMHAYLLGLPGVNFVGHTHPIAVNGLLCATRAEELVSHSYFPDQIVCCGVAPVFVPYVDPGIPLARAVRDRVTAWMAHYGETPKAILLRNHGLFALGTTPQQVEMCTLMWQKTAQVIAIADSCGGAQALTDAEAARIATRPDELLRAKMLGGGK
jgi:rhamnose utilization protein RhaD (predicted bifunctional aldolase and dehydrogenase)